MATDQPTQPLNPLQLSLVIPAYNEAERIAETLGAVCAYLRAQPGDAEVLVVDDGSRDATAERVRECQAACPGLIRLIQLPHNEGKGAAVRAGMLQGRGAYRVFYDADGSTPIAELEKLLPRLAAGADIVIGSRALAESQIETRQAWYRETMGRVFNLILRALGLTPFRDTQCGFKGFTANACELVFPRQTLSGFSFDAELLHIARRKGLRVDEVPVRWRNAPQSRVNPLTDSMKMLIDLFRIRWKDFRGIYD